MDDNTGYDLTIIVADTVETGNRIMEDLDRVIAEAGDETFTRIPTVALVAIKSFMTVEQKLLIGCHELQAEAVDRIDRFLRSHETK